MRKKEHDRHSEKFHKLCQSLDWHQGTVIWVIDSIGKDYSLWATQTWPNHYLASFSRTTAIEAGDSKKQSDFLYSKGIVFHHDIDKSHTSSVIRQKVRKLGWEVLIHLTYNPDVGQSDCRLFWFLENSVSSVKLDLKELVKIICFRFMPRNLRSLQ